ncbi:LysR family transcriptional regulator [Pseudomonas aeruginosa]|jgi:LysR family transcriptional regulator, transcriptional activator for leuABCD operon|nr:LysR family transcriptional regulator [Pseudomonas aeruginosa]MCS9139087.1 LysR family transcriptional regulator [Pseudomonas aeruginosa]MCS9211932.1 LysR family transcriptional regulator [Pseudomonas aeruginosa]
MPSDISVLRSLDLNALVVLVMVHRERNASRTAQLLGLTQPAVSNVLGKLRRLFDDPLFLRVGRGLVPTDRANEIVKALEPAIQGVEEALDRYLRQAADVRETFFLAVN